jgi:hypothetical protein
MKGVLLLWFVGLVVPLQEIFALHCIENPIYVFPEMKLHGLVPNSYIHVSVSDLYIPRTSMPMWLQQIRQADPGNILHAHRYECGNWETEHYNSILEVTRPNSFISGNTSMENRHLYWILTGPSFAVCLG